MIRNIICALITILFLGQTFEVSAAEKSQLKPSDIFSENAISIEVNSGKVLFEKNASEKGFPASITKVMTGILLLEHVAEDEKITMTEESLHEERSNSIVEFTAGEQLNRDTALYFLMMLSANDVATSIGEHIAGSKEAFGKLMTERAKELGATNTNFTNPSGLHDENHYTTAHDMALIVREATNYPLLMEAMSTRTKELTTSKQTITIPNRSNMFDIEHFYAGKTGFTTPARNTLVEIAEKNGVYIVNVVMRSGKPQYYEDMEKLTNHAFSQIEEIIVIDRSDWSETYKILDEPVSVVVERSVQIPAKKNSTPQIETVFHPKDISKEELFSIGIFKGDEVGSLDVLVDGNVVETVPVVASENVIFEKTFLAALTEELEQLLQFNTWTIAIGGLVGTVLVIRTVNITRRKIMKKRRRAEVRRWN